jgi:hypothetical protein
MNITLISIKFREEFDNWLIGSIHPFLQYSETLFNWVYTYKYIKFLHHFKDRHETNFRILF